ncbi:MAG: hypothetical protein ACTSR8_09915 [Promethearchaeota archaeon]
MSNNAENTEIEKKSSDGEDQSPKKPVKKTQSQIIQEALGLEQGDIQEVEKKLFIARFFDFYSQETLDFIYKDHSIEVYQKEIDKFLNELETKDEENKLLKRQFEELHLFDIVYMLKKKAETIALSAGIKEPIDKRLRKISLFVMLPMFAILIGLTLIQNMSLFLLFPLLCLFCMIPQFIRTSIIKKWYEFKEQHRNQFWQENRDDIMILKGYTGEVLNNVRNKLLDLKVPLQLIKFVLHSRDYENLTLINQRNVRGANQYFFTFEYPPGMEPFPVPQILQPRQPIAEDNVKSEPERNFIILTDLKAKNGIIDAFVPMLRDNLADQINTLLNECEFSKAPLTFKDIIPNYSKKLGIYCVCGELAQISNIQVCTWKNQFKFYLFESVPCKCNDQLYVLSLMDNVSVVPEQLKEIFV